MSIALVTSQDPAFAVFERGDVRILVPHLLVGSANSPTDYAQKVNGLQLIDVDQTTLKTTPSDERTSKAIADIIRHSPLIMGGGAAGYVPGVSVKSNVSGKLEYVAFSQNKPLKRGVRKLDYVFTSSAAQTYANLAGICDREEFSRAKKTVRLAPFYCSAAAGMDSPFRTIELYLVADINTLSKSR